MPQIGMSVMVINYAPRVVYYAPRKNYSIGVACSMHYKNF